MVQLRMCTLYRANKDMIMKWLLVRVLYPLNPLYRVTVHVGKPQLHHVTIQLDETLSSPSPQLQHLMVQLAHYQAPRCNPITPFNGPIGSSPSPQLHHVIRSNWLITKPQGVTQLHIMYRVTRHVGNPQGHVTRDCTVCGNKNVPPKPP